MTFYERMESVLSHLRRAETIAVFSLDLDRFKAVNDTLGHPIGDLLLQTAAERMRRCVRAKISWRAWAATSSPSCRFHRNSPPDVTALATHLIEVDRGALRSRWPSSRSSEQASVSPSRRTTATNPDALMKNADLALYRAKADGRGVFRFFEIEMDARMQARRALELDLRKAIANGEFELHYQPIIDVKSGQINSCEALIRWHHPERGMVAPLEFIPVAEETGLIVPSANGCCGRPVTKQRAGPST